MIPAIVQMRLLDPAFEDRVSFGKADGAEVRIGVVI